MEELVSKAQQNRLYIDAFLSYLKDVQGYSEKTIVSYAHDLMRLDKFLDKNEIEVSAMSFENAKAFTVELYEQDLSHATINRILSANRSFFHSMCENGICKADPFKRVSSAKNTRRIPTVLSQEEIDRILSSPVEDYTSLMEVTMFNIFYSTGCRLSEVMGMKVQDLDIAKRRIKVLGKGNKQRFVFLTGRCLAMLEAYLPQRREVLERTGQKECEVLLVNAKGKELPLSTVHSIFDKYSQRLGLSKKFTPHVFRHTFASNMLDNDSDIRLVQALLGHQSIGTTQIYTHITDSKLTEVYRNSHPHGRNDE